MPLLFSTEYIKMGFEARNLLDEDTEWESAMCFAEQMVTEAVLNNVNGIIKKTENGVTLTFIKTPRKNQPEQKKSIRSATKATAEKKIPSTSKATIKKQTNDSSTITTPLSKRKSKDSDTKPKKCGNLSAPKRKKTE